MSESSLFTAFGAALGYIGAEAVTELSIERMLWPQRFYSNFTLASLPVLVFFMPMGGPLHKAALKALDAIFLHGLFKGANQGRMLGTSFFHQLDWEYTMHDEHGPSHTGPLRNCLWSRVLSYIPIPMLDRERCTDAAPGDSAGKGIVPARRSTLPLRARTVVSHLTLSRPTAEDLASQDLPFVGEGVGIPGLRVFLAVCATELSALVTAFGIFAAYRSLWALLWFLPLLLRLIGTFFALEREPLVSTSSSVASDPPCDFEIHCPRSEGNFMVVTGPPALVLQFVRHYGHPIRNRFREIVQLSTIIAFALQFPLGLFCSSMWMPVEVQYVWLSYQLYVVLAMHVVRYSVAGRSTTTEAKLAECLGRGSLLQMAGKNSTTTANESAVLFGHKRDGEGTLKAQVAFSYHERYGQGKLAVEQLLHRHKVSQE